MDYDTSMLNAGVLSDRFHLEISSSTTGLVIPKFIRYLILAWSSGMIVGCCELELLGQIREMVLLVLWTSNQEADDYYMYENNNYK